MERTHLMSVLLVFMQIYDYSANPPKCPTTMRFLGFLGPMSVGHTP